MPDITALVVIAIDIENEADLYEIKILERSI